MPHYELVRPAASLEPAPLLLAVSGQMLVAAAVPPCGYDSDKDPDNDSDHSGRRSWLRRLLVTGFPSRKREKREKP
ncbi:hypothetical protein ACFT9I_17760 [Streptomyces sp. NPDC057137]|uniref:hypothetical protein n=1 Tax=Streptomyces sp. NPDC057137 TaxID=3346030 RepID=UPI00362509EF